MTFNNRINIPGTPVPKYVFIFWCPEELALGSQRATIVKHSQQLAAFVKSYNMILTATKDDELKEEFIIHKLKLKEQ